jgi:hypothetical protein
VAAQRGRVAGGARAVYKWFVEGEDAADLEGARAMLAGRIGSRVDH